MTNWGKSRRENHSARQGLIKGAPPAVRHVEIEVRGRGGRWELTAGNGLTARCLYVHRSEAAAMLDAERVGLALQAVER